MQRAVVVRPNQYEPKLAVTAAADDTLYITLAQGVSQDDTIDALHDEIAASEALIGGSRDEARRHELRVTLRGFMANVGLDDCWGVVLRAELLRADWALRRLPANTAAQHDAQKNCRRHLAWELRSMDWMWLRLAGTVSEDHGMLEAACAAEQDLHDAEGNWQHRIRARRLMCAPSDPPCT